MLCLKNVLEWHAHTRASKAEGWNPADEQSWPLLSNLVVVSVFHPYFYPITQVGEHIAEQPRNQATVPQ